MLSSLHTPIMMPFSVMSLLAMELEEFEQLNQPDRHNTVTNVGTTSSPPLSPPPPPESPISISGYGRNKPLPFLSSLLDDEDTNGFHEFTLGVISDEPLVSFATLPFSTTPPLALACCHQPQ
jgi:hypothetical protein